MIPPLLADGTTESIGYYERGASTYFAAQCDQRFGYYLYVPRNFDFSHAADYRLCVVIHGTGRTPSVYRDHFAEFAEANNVIVIAPLFPAGIIEPGELSNYKFIAFHDIRFDHVLLGIVDEVANRFHISERRFLLFGFSGGGHFTHRFAYLHPSALLGISVGAPGMITLINDKLPWWRGTADLAELFGIALDLDELRRIPVQLVVGAEDTETWEITIQPGTRHWMDGANDAGRTRIDRIHTLRDNFVACGIAARLDFVPGIAHSGYEIIDPVRAFFAEVLRLHRAGDSTLSAVTGEGGR